jgi:putative membrane protein
MAPDNSQSLAVERTFLAHERTLMAWVRTSTSLISFGFTIYKFFAFLVQTEHRSFERKGLGPREFALAMITVGIVTLTLAVIQERKAFKILEAQNQANYSSLAEKIAAALVLLGLLLLILVLLRQ